MATTVEVGSRRMGAMSDAHKAALAEGREQGQMVRRYLEALQAQQARRGRRQSPDSVQKRLDEIELEIGSASPVARLQLVQERLDLVDELESAKDDTRWQELEEAFLGCARAYSQRKGISYAAWREIGVSASVLRKAGIHR